MISDRRCHPRQVVYSAVYVHLSPNSGGFLADLSEGGLGLGLFFPAVSGQVVRLGFDLPETSAHIEANCRIAWTDESGQKAGVQFLDLPETVRHHIREWLLVRALSGNSDEAITTQSEVEIQVEIDELELCSSSSEATQGRESDDGLVSDSGPALSQPQRISEPKQGEQDALEHEVRNKGNGEVVLGTPRRAGLLTGLVALSALILVLIYVSGRRESSSEPSTAPKADQEMVRPSDALSPSVKPLGRSASDSTLSVPLIPRGAVVLQVAALPRESDALGMAEALQKKKFPAFVLKLSADQYYRVQVGPYADAESVAIARGGLEHEGFKAIVKH